MSTAATPTGRIRVVKPDSSHEWEIDNFCLDRWKTGDELISPTIFVADTKWQIHLYPRGINARNKKHVSIALETLNESIVKISLLLSVISKRNDKYWSWGTTCPFRKEKKCGNGSFIPQYALIEKKSGLLPNDKLTILCNIEILTQNLSVDCSEIGNVSKFDKFLNSKQFSDVTFIVGGKDFYAHKNILANGSTVFAAMFEHNMKENLENTVEISDISYEIFTEMFRFIYTGKVINIGNIAEALYIAADKYALYELAAACVSTLCRSISLDNAIAHLKFADIYGIDRLKTSAMDFIVSHANDIIRRPSFASIYGLPQSIMVEIFQRFATKGLETDSSRKRKRDSD